MRQFLLVAFILFYSLGILAQQTVRDSGSVAMNSRSSYSENAARLSIYPVPVKNNGFTIKSDREVSSVKVTNIIGQDIFREKYNNPQQMVHVSLDAPQRGMYLVTIVFDDGLRVVKKIMIEESK